MILALGTVTLDTIDAPGGGVIDVPGGSALFSAAAACRVASVRPVGVVGADYPLAALRPLGARGVDLEGLRTSDHNSLRWHARYDEEGRRTTISSDRSILESFDPTLSAEEAAAPWVFLGSIDPRIQGRVLDQVTAPIGVGLDSMGHWIEGRREELMSLIARATVYFGSEGEVRVLGESDDVD
ncbi:MAG: sugar kinase, partial [Longimicrobiales bacterium]